MTASTATTDNPTPDIHFEPGSYFGLDIPFMRYIGLRAKSLSVEDGACTTLSLTDELVNSRGEVHGGTLMSALDFTMTAAARSHDPLGFMVATIEMSTHFLAPSRSDLTFKARVLRRGRSTAFCEGTAFDSDNTAVCIARGTFRLIPVNRDR